MPLAARQRSVLTPVADNQGVAVGFGASGNGMNPIALGYNSSASGYNPLAIGKQAVAGDLVHGDWQSHRQRTYHGHRDLWDGDWLERHGQRLRHNGHRLGCQCQRERLRGDWLPCQRGDGQRGHRRELQRFGTEFHCDWCQHHQHQQ